MKAIFWALNKKNFVKFGPQRTVIGAHVDLP